MKIAALGSTLALTGVAMAQNTEGATSPLDRGSVSGSSTDGPSSGAIVTPQDNALGMGHADARPGDSNGDVNDNSSTSNDSRSIIDPGQTKDEGLSVNPGASNDEEFSSPPTTGARPGDMGPASVRGE